MIEINDYEPIANPEKRGYDITLHGSVAMEIERIDEMNKYPTDALAVMQALRDGIELLPIDELPEKFPYKWLGWLNTPLNRKAIQMFADTAEPKEPVAKAPVEETGIVITPKIKAYIQRYQYQQDKARVEALNAIINDSKAFENAADEQNDILARFGFFDTEITHSILECCLHTDIRAINGFCGTAAATKLNQPPMDIDLADHDMLLILQDTDDNRELLRKIMPEDFNIDTVVYFVHGVGR